MRSAIFEWEGKEYEPVERSADWYWALGIIAIAGSIAAILFANYLIALLILAAAFALGTHAAKKPETHRFLVTEDGLWTGNEFHPFDRMLSFSMLEDIEGELPPLLSIHTEGWLSPHLVIPLEGVDADAVYTYFYEHVDEGEHRHTWSDLLAAWLGF